MAASKNNPENRNKEGNLVQRTCDICGTTAPIVTGVERILVKRTLIWRCKNGCKK